MQADQTHILQLSATSSKSIPALYKEVTSTMSTAIRVELYLDVSEYAHSQRSNGKSQPLILVSELLLLLFQNVPNLKELCIEGYEMYCHSKDYMIFYEDNVYGLFYSFEGFVKKYTMTGETQPYFKSVENMEFKRCCMTEDDLKVVCSSIFPNLKSTYFSYSTPVRYKIREKYEDFLPNSEWDDKYDLYYLEEVLTNKNRPRYYNPSYNEAINQ